MGPSQKACIRNSGWRGRSLVVGLSLLAAPAAANELRRNCCASSSNMTGGTGVEAVFGLDRKHVLGAVIASGPMQQTLSMQ